MKVKDLIEKLLKMPQEAEVKIYLRQSENLIEIEKVEKTKSICGDKKIDSVDIVADWTDFKLDEEADYFCKEKLSEWARPY